ncbi:MAG: peptidase domain-containing ABC transporter [Calothrix sp. C42_A2020_038]|nr:peptidase domain-containing ABC transporter [Calothrix sp. C42_A2020_038]
MNFSPLSRVQGEHDNNQHSNLDYVLSPTQLATINRFLRLVATDTSLAVLKFSWVIREFSLGDELQDESTADAFSLVCEGRVRLLGYDNESARTVSTQLLDVGETFGTDRLFCAGGLSYRVVAASVGCIASLSITDLEIWLQHSDDLRSYLQETVETRQKLIFWKTCTEFRIYQSQILKRLSPYFELRRVKSNEFLHESTPAVQGRYWLMHGNISSKDLQVQVPEIGNSWGYPDLILPSLTAATDLLICHLPIENWEFVKQFLPLLSHQKQSSNNSLKIVSYPAHAQVELDNRDHVELFPQFESKKYINQPNRKYPFIAQQSSSDCGAACLAMICRYWGKKISLNTLQKTACVTRVGTTLDALADASVSLGYQAVAVRGSLRSLSWQHLPWIAHWQGNHYVVVWEVQANSMVISDPALGMRKLAISEFEQNWTGYALVLEPTERLQKLKDEKISHLHFWKSLLRYRYLVLQIITASVVMQVFGLVMPVIAQVIIDKVIPARMTVTLNVFACLFMVFGIWRLGIRAARQHLLDYFSNHMDMSLMSSFIRHLLELPLQFFMLRHVGDIMSRAEENYKIQSFLTRRALNITLDALCAFLCFGLIAYYHSQLALFTLGLTLPVALLTMSVNPSIKRTSREVAQNAAVQNNAVSEMIAGIVTIKGLNGERWMRWRWEEQFVSAIKARLRLQKLANNLQFVNSLINHISSTAVLWYAASLMMQEQLSLGQFVAFNMLFSSIINPVLAFVELRNDFQSFLVSIERLNDVLLSSCEADQVSLQVMPEIRGEVRFENVNFQHQHEKHHTLQNISFCIKAGQIVGIVGLSGAGKTTLVNLLCGLYKPNSGRILIDGHDTAMILPQTLRTQLGVVPSDIFIFSGTILENITLFNPEFTFSDVKKAAIKAGVHDFVKALPQGYNTLVGLTGRTLSIRERYLIAIARVLIRKPKILILDESTNSLDTQTNQEIKQNLLRGSVACTTFIVTHSISDLHTADRILLLDRGIIVQQGRHEELVANKLYSHLVLQQAYR